VTIQIAEKNALPAATLVGCLFGIDADMSTIAWIFGSRCDGGKNLRKMLCHWRARKEDTKKTSIWIVEGYWNQTIPQRQKARENNCVDVQEFRAYGD